MPQIFSQIVITKTVSAVFGNEKDGMCLVFIKNKGFGVFFLFSLFLDMLCLFGQHCVKLLHSFFFLQM